MIIKTKADWWGNGSSGSPRDIIITGNERGVFVSDQKAEVTFTGTQLRLVTSSSKYLISNGKSHADISIQEMFNRLEPFIEK